MHQTRQVPLCIKDSISPTRCTRSQISVFFHLNRQNMFLFFPRQMAIPLSPQSWQSPWRKSQGRSTQSWVCWVQCPSTKISHPPIWASRRIRLSLSPPWIPRQVSQVCPRCTQTTAPLPSFPPRGYQNLGTGLRRGLWQLGLSSAPLSAACWKPVSDGLKLMNVWNSAGPHCFVGVFPGAPVDHFTSGHTKPPSTYMASR